MSAQRCTAPGYWYAGQHLASWPASDRSPVSWCPECLGFGTVRQPGDTQAAFYGHDERIGR